MLYLWLGKASPATWLRDVLGTTSVGSMGRSLEELSAAVLTPRPNFSSRAIQSLVQTMRARRPSFLPLCVVPEGSQSLVEVRFWQQFAYDRQKNMLGYNDFLQQLQQRVQAKLASSSSTQ